MILRYLLFNFVETFQHFVTFSKAALIISFEVFFLHIIKLNTLYYCSTVLLITFVYISYFVECSFLKIYCDCEKWVSETQTKLVENL